VSPQWKPARSFNNLGESGVTGLTGLDIRLLVKIVGDAAVAGGDLGEKRKFLLGAVAELVAAEAWAWSWQGKDAELFRSGAPQIITGGDETILPRTFLKPSLERVTHRTKSGSSLKTIGRWTSPKNGDEPAQYSYVPSHGTFTIGMSCHSRKLVSSIIFARNAQRRIFTARERKIVDIVGQEVVWLHDPGRKAPVTSGIPALSPKKKLIVQLLSAGLDRKAIAAQLHISVNTAHSYIKSIYRNYRVNSQAELTRIFADTNYEK